MDWKSKNLDCLLREKFFDFSLQLRLGGEVRGEVCGGGWGEVCDVVYWEVWG